MDEYSGNWRAILSVLSLNFGWRLILGREHPGGVRLLRDGGTWSAGVAKMARTEADACRYSPA